MKPERRLKKNKGIRSSCEKLLKEVAYLQKDIDLLKENNGSMQAILRLREQQNDLRLICDELRCPEDTSPEAKRRNKDLLKEIKKEII